MFTVTCMIKKSLKLKGCFQSSFSLFKFPTNLKGFNKYFVTFSYLGAGVTNSEFRDRFLKN